jgi:4'-phosphopantetheinyl transferase
MPLNFIESVGENIYLSGWNISEGEESLLHTAYLSEEDLELLGAVHHPSKRLEFLAGRSLVYKMMTELSIGYNGVFRNEYGKPELLTSQYQLSLSHTQNFVVALVGKGVNVGIDIEMPQAKMERIASRLYSEEELAICKDDLALLSKIWSAKEVLYKLHMVGGIDFKKHLQVGSFDEQFSSCIGTINKDGVENRYALHFKPLGSYYICYNTNS